MEKKITKAQMFAMIKDAVADNAEFVEFLDKQIELLNRKSVNKKPTAVQLANEVLKENILAVLGGFENGATASEVLKANDDFAEFSNQKISTMLNQLVSEGKVVKTTDKKKSIFSVVE